MRIEEVDGLQAGERVDEAIKPAVEALDAMPKNLRGILYVYDEEHDKATVALVNYTDNLHVVKDADAIAFGVRGMK